MIGDFHSNLVLPNSNEPRSVTIIRAMKNYLLKTSVKETDYVDDVRKIYWILVKPSARTIRFHDPLTDDDLWANRQLLFRQINGVNGQRLSVDVEEAMVFALPLPEREQLLVKLSARYGSYYAPLMEKVSVNGIVSISKLMNHTGELLERWAEIIEDNKVDENDRHLAPGAIEKIDETVGVLLSLREQLSAIMPKAQHGNVVTLNTEDNNSA